jgi:integrase
MTGWRIGALVALRKDHVDLDAGTALSLAKDNKGKRDQKIKLHPVVVEHLRRIQGDFSSPRVFAWNANHRSLSSEFARVQERAGIHLPCIREHKHTRHCFLYGWHDIRRSFATVNSERLTPKCLQALMQHRSFTTTLKYIAMAKQLDAAVDSLHVPECLKSGAQG